MSLSFLNLEPPSPQSSPPGRGGCFSSKSNRSVISAFGLSSSFVIRASSFFQRSSFVTQRFNRIEGGGFSRRIKAEENSNGCTEKEGEHDRSGRNQRRPMLDRRKNLRGHNAENNAEQSSNGTQ